MKIAVCGNAPDGVVRKIQSIVKGNIVSVKKSDVHHIVDVAKETYETYDGNVVFNDCALCYLNGADSDSLFEVYEQIALCSLSNLNLVYVVTEGMKERDVMFYKEYANMFPDKIRIIVDENDIEL